MMARGVKVSGSDGRDSSTVQALRAEGADVFVGHRADHLGSADTVVVSTAIGEDNEEVLEALARGLRVWPRSAALASVMLGKDVLAVAGTHGKTTTTSLLVAALSAAGADPTYTIGGDLTASGRNAVDGSGRYFVAEADESDGAFLVYSPYAAIVTNVEADHLDHFGTESAYRDAFRSFVDRVDSAGVLVCVVDDPGACDLADHARKLGGSVITVGESEHAALRAANVRFEGHFSAFEVWRDNTMLGKVRLQIPGRHYVMDALGALALGLHLGFAFGDLVQGLSSFTGTHRRMEAKGSAAGVSVYDSYAHHPREIQADLEAARAIAGTGALLVVFQPHLVSRTRIFGAEMGRALSAADSVVVLDVYLARELPDPEVTGQLVAQAVEPGKARFVADFDSVPDLMVDLSQSGDFILTLGAGNVTELAPRILGRLQEKASG